MPAADQSPQDTAAQQVHALTVALSPRQASSSSAFTPSGVTVRGRQINGSPVFELVTIAAPRLASVVAAEAERR